MKTSRVLEETTAIVLAVANELERLAAHDVDPTDILPDWLLESLPEPDGREYLSHARDRWGPIVQLLRANGVPDAQ
jgi:hypothetical protein